MKNLQKHKRYKGKPFKFSCHNCDYEGQGFKEYDEIGYKDNMLDLVECPKCKMGMII